MTNLEEVQKFYYLEIIDSIEVYGHTEASIEYVYEAMKYFIKKEQYEYCITLKSYLEKIKKENVI
jgi:hypothetical protein